MGPTAGGALVAAEAQPVLDAVQAAVDAVQEHAGPDLQRCLSALVRPGVARGAALVRRHDGRVEVVAAEGALPGQLTTTLTRVLAMGSAVRAAGLLAVPVPCPQLADLALVADVDTPADVDARSDIADDGAATVLVRTMAHALAMRLELIDVRRRLRAAETRTDTLMTAAQALGRTLELRDLFTAILGQLRMVVPYDSASVQRLEGSFLRIIGGHGFPNPDEILGLSFDMRATTNPNRLVMASWRPMILPDASAEYPSFRQGPHLPASIRGWLGVPLVFGDRLLGMLSIDSREADFYDEDHARIAEAFATQAAIAMENARLFGEMRRMATHDALTGLPNRRQLEDGGADALDVARDAGLPVALLLCDLDQFKVVNDTHGHAVGDEVLREVANRLLRLVRPEDLLARFGGEEFVVLLPSTDPSAAASVAERIRRGVADHPIATMIGDINVTISIGLASSCPAAEPLSDLLREADRALYEAKAQGRDRVVAR